MGEFFEELARAFDMSPEELKEAGGAFMIVIFALYCCLITCLCACSCTTIGVGAVKTYKTLKTNKRVFQQIDMAKAKAQERIDVAMAIQQSAQTNPAIFNNIQQDGSPVHVVQVSQVPVANQQQPQTQLLTGRSANSQQQNLNTTTESSLDEDRNLLV